MKEEIVITRCDACGRDHEDVNTGSRHGSGRLVFQHRGGGDGGGASNEEILEDLCIDCCERLVQVIQDFKEEREKFYKKST